MKFTLQSTAPQSAQHEYLLVLVTEQQLKNTADTYKINTLDTITHTSQFKSGFNEVLTLIGQAETCSYLNLVGLGDLKDLQPAKIAKLAQTIIKLVQTKFKQIHLDISALPIELHYLFALNLTQANYVFDEFKSKKVKHSLNRFT